MAGRWRIKHKLIVGLGMVLVIMGLLLAGTLKGLLSYRTTTRTIDSKLLELNSAFELSATIKLLSDPPDHLPTAHGELIKRVQDARAKLAEFAERVTDAANRGRGPEQFYKDQKGRIVALGQRLDDFEQAVNKHYYQPRAGKSSPPVLEDQEVKQGNLMLKAVCDELTGVINEVAYKRIQTANRDYNFSMTLVLVTSFLAVFLMAGLLRFFYRWVFFPIRDLQLSVGKVARGDFDHLIELHSADEIEELADAFNDMTVRLRDMYRDLASQVNERSRQLVRSERLASVGFLAAGVAHEINNPLASIAFCSEALERRLADFLGRLSPQDAETVTKYLRMIQQEAFRCKDITQRLLEFSRGGDRKREPTDLAEVVQNVLDMVQHHEISKGKDLVFQPAGRVTASVNAQEIKQVVLNLVFNALENMDEGGRLAIALEQHAGTARLRFTDTGSGMAPEVLENIFEPFFTRSLTGKGTGLGLSISHRIISQHGGEIEAYTAGPGQGSTFTVHLPLQPVEEQAAEPPVMRPRLAA